MNIESVRLFESTQAVRERLRNGAALPEGLEAPLSRMVTDALLAITALIIAEELLNEYRNNQGQPEPGAGSCALPGQLGIDLGETKGGEA